jgi:PAS domain-containing protein
MPRKLPDRRPALVPSSAIPQAAQDAAHAILSTMLDSVAQGTAMFDQDHRLIGWNGRLQQLLDLPDGMLSEALTFKDFVAILAERGSSGTQSARIEAATRELTTALDQPYVTERMLSDGRVIECRRQALPGGGLMVLLSDPAARYEFSLYRRRMRACPGSYASRWRGRERPDGKILPNTMQECGWLGCPSNDQHVDGMCCMRQAITDGRGERPMDRFAPH